MDVSEPPVQSDAGLALGRAFRRARHENGLSQEALGSLARLSQSAISRIETGTANGVRYKTLLRILNALDVRGVAFTVRRHSWVGDDDHGVSRS